jgi:hypothetical protein
MRIEYSVPCSFVNLAAVILRVRISPLNRSFWRSEFFASLLSLKQVISFLQTTQGD